MTTPRDEDPSSPVETLRAANAALSLRLEEAEETIRAIRQGAVDAFVVGELPNYRIYTLEGADRPYRVFVEQMEQGVVTIHEDGSIVYCNRRLADLLEAPHQSLIGAALRDFIVSEDLPAYDGLISQGKLRPAQSEIRLRRPNGSVLEASLSFEPLPEDSGGLIGAFITDLTAQKRHEQLVAAQSALQEADRRKNEFLALLAHELRNPLAPMRNAVDILHLTAEDPAAVHATSQMLARQVGQMVRFVDDLLDASRVSRNRIELHRERVELGTIIQQAVEAVRPLCTELGHDLSVSLPENPIYLDGDAVRLTQVFANLLDNACKYMARGGRIRVIAEAVTGSPDTEPEVAVRIQDGGIGIDPQHLPRIFEMFVQADTSLERSRSGLGIGLTLVRNLVELHGGRVDAHSQGQGHGSEFVVHLPMATGAGWEPAQEPTREDTMTSYRILVVDDNRDSAESLALLLQLMGHETRTAFDGEQAIEETAAFQPEVVLMDVGMPKLNGYDACRRIRAETWGRNMILIAQTGWGQDEDRRRTEEAGFDAHFVKPVDPAALMKMLNSLTLRVAP